MDRDKRALLYGLVIGDGHIGKYKDKRWDTYQYTLQLKHSIKQKSYLEYKVELISYIFNCKPPKIVEIDNNGYPGCIARKGNNKILRIIHKDLYSNKKKVISRKVLDRLNPQAIAIWYMDDGNLSMKRRDGKIHGREFFLNTHTTREENQVIIDYFKEVHNIKMRQVKNRGHYRLSWGATEGKKFIKLVEPYIIPSMNYKIDMQYKK